MDFATFTGKLSQEELVKITATNFQNAIKAFLKPGHAVTSEYPLDNALYYHIFNNINQGVHLHIKLPY